jgi:hypothetical protein
VQVKAGVKTGEQVVLYPSDQVREDIQVSASTAGES